MNNLQVKIARTGHAYTYSRIIDGQANPKNATITADRAQEICTANANEVAQRDGQMDFGVRPCTWSVTFSFSLEVTAA